MAAGQAGLAEELEQARAAGPAQWGQVRGPPGLTLEEQADRLKEEW